jgi:hypothetical protein
VETAGLGAAAMTAMKKDLVKKTAGCALLALSVVAWGAIAALPLLDLSPSAAIAWTSSLVIGGEIAFLAGIAVLGREGWQKIKSIFGRQP